MRFLQGSYKILARNAFFINQGLGGKQVERKIRNFPKTGRPENGKFYERNDQKMQNCFSEETNAPIVTK